MAKILVIDDEEAFRDGVIETLSDLGAEARGANSVSAAMAALAQQSFDAVFIDYRMPGIDGLEGMKRIKDWAGEKSLPIVMITAHFDSENTISAMKMGAFDHLTKPISRSDIKRILDGLVQAFPKASKMGRTKADIRDRYALIGNSPELREVLKLIGKLSSHDSTVLITGETGTGKELVARAIHRNSERASAPFIAINCAAIPENLLESELFGHVKGAFTGAMQDRKGSFQMAEGGTVLLDEIGDMSFSLQAKLLRTLQEREISPLGSARPIKINCRFLAATHQNIKAMVTRKEFREDLYYRLNVVELRLPSLRERASDISILARHFLDQVRSENATVQKQMSPEAISKLEAHSWPGNIRELKNVIERAFIVSNGKWINEIDIRFLIDDKPNLVASDGLDLPSAIAQLEQSYIARALIESSGNRSEAARKLGIQRQLLYTKMKEYCNEL